MIVVHGKSDCPFCVKAKAWLDEHLIEFTSITYDDNAERQAMYDRFGLVGRERTVPQITVDGVRIGGYTELVESGLEKTASLDFSI